MSTDVKSITEPQDIFDTVVKHLFTQGKPAMDDGTCMYRGPDGAKCAVGVLIADDEYRHGFEFRELPDLLSLIDGTPLERRLSKNLRLLRDLQAAHDTRDNRTQEGRFDLQALERDLFTIAHRHDLEYNQPLVA